MDTQRKDGQRQQRQKLEGYSLKPRIVVTSRSYQREMEQVLSPWEVPERSNPAHILVSDIQPHELEDNKFLLFKVTQFVAVY